MLVWVQVPGRLENVPDVILAPPPLGVAQVPSPRQKVEDDADVPLLRLVTGRFPVTSAPARFTAELVTVCVDPAKCAMPTPGEDATTHVVQVSVRLLDKAPPPPNGDVVLTVRAVGTKDPPAVST